MDPNVPFSDTSARRAELMEATEQYKSSIETNVQALKGDAVEVGKSVALVAGVCFAVFVVASILLPKSNDEDEDDEDYDDEEADNHLYENSTKAQARRAAKAAEEAPKKSAIGGAITGILTSIVTNMARQQVTDFMSRLRQNNAAQQQPTATSPYTPSATNNPL
ncbi:hypothetical protein [Larkinella soli]|uniref:hypothetical protein n=1 Tax=Larkinella soli TaxID=1770527 RepID=UPI000FFC5BD4|nr:hypothetical protein [Larkinella soli]